MGFTLRQIAGSAHVQLKQTGDDADVSFAQVVMWCSFFINKVRYSKLTQAREFDSGQYLTIYTDLPVLQFSANVNPNQVMGRKYFELPSNILNLNYDGGIKYITYSQFEDVDLPSFSGVTFSRTTPSKAARLWFSPYETPSPQNPYFYRVHEYIYTLGIEDINVKTLEIGIITEFDPFRECDLDEEIGDAEMFDYITKSVIDLGKFALIIPTRTINDGTDASVTSQMPKTKLTSVNSDIAAQQQQQPTE